MPLSEKEIEEILEFQKQWKSKESERQKEREEEKQRYLKEFEEEIAKFNAPEPKIPLEIKPIIPSFDQFMNEVYEKPEIDVGFRNAISHWETAWGKKGEADAGDWNHYKEKMVYKDAKEEREFREQCVYAKDKGTLRVNDECYKKAFKIYRDYAKPVFQSVVNKVSKNVKKKVPFYRFLDIKNAEELKQALIEQSKTQVQSKKTTGTYWSWNLDEHRNIVNPRNEAARQASRQSSLDSNDYEKEMNKWDFLFFRGYTTDPENVNFHDSVSSNMGGLDHAEIRMKENTEMEIDKVCIAHEYQDGWDTIRGKKADKQCIIFEKPIRLLTKEKDEKK